MMKRREFITLLGGATAWPATARAQRAGVRRVGVFMRLLESDPVTKGYLVAFAQGLAPLGWNERNLQVLSRLSSSGDTGANAAAADLVRQNPEVILSHGTETSRIMQQHSRTIPIVFTTVTDPVGSGLVESLARPGGNTTGFTNFEFSMAGKWLELLKEVAPAVRNIAVIFNPDNATMSGQLRAIALAAPALELQLTEAKVTDSGDIERAINELAQTSNAGFIVLPENVVISNRDLIIAMATRHRLPAIYSDRINVQIGGLLSYGADTDDLYRRAASYVDRILRGEKPSDLPVQQPTKFQLAVNLKAAMGLTIPESILLRADEVIE
jgi:putative tryptophan/tyrosine transport system substrate-binding protein